MGEIVLAAKVTHVPTIWLSEQVEKHKGIRQAAIDGLQELGRRAAARGVDTFVVFDSHWIVNQGFHLNACARLEGRFTSHELPHFLFDMEYRYQGDPELANLIVNRGNNAGLKTLAHDVPGLGFEYGTLIPMRHMNPEGRARVLSVACDQFTDVDENRRFGAAVADAIRESGRKVAVVASGSLSHQFWPNALSAEGLNTVNREFNRQVDLRVLDLWQTGQIATFLDILPDYAERCHGEVGMADTAMLFGALGWDAYTGKGEVLTPYFGSSGTGQCVVEFPLT